MLALLFPGQGVGADSVRDDVAEHRPDLLELAGELVGADPFARFGDGTRFAQPAIFCASLAGVERLGRPPAGLYAGHSLGEITALAAAGAIDDADGLRIVAARGQLMADAAEATEPGGMLAVGAALASAAALADRHGLTLANENSPTQCVLSGTDDALAAAELDAKGEGLRAKRLPIRGAFHSSAMKTAARPFAELLARIDFVAPAAPVYSCVTATRFDSDPRPLLAEALTRPVRWVEVVRGLHAAGAERFVDVGPGRVLAGLVRRTLDDVAVEDNRQLEAEHA